MLGKCDVVSNIVTVRKEHKIHAAHFFDALYERRCKSRGIDQHVPALLLRTNDQIRPRSETRFRCEAAKVNIVHNVNRKRGDARAGAAVRRCADRSSRTRNQRHQCAMQLAGIVRLPVNAGLSAMVAKTRGRDLPASIAIDAGGVHEELAVHVFRQALSDLGHDR